MDTGLVFVLAFAEGFPDLSTAGAVGDVRNEHVLEEHFEDVDVLLHLAAPSGVHDYNENADTAFDVNVGGTENVSWFCRKREIPLVFPCSMAIIGEPVELPITADHP
jgi:UDP-glucose 4-epimerase